MTNSRVHPQHPFSIPNRLRSPPKTYFSPKIALNDSTESQSTERTPDFFLPKLIIFTQHKNNTVCSFHQTSEVHPLQLRNTENKQKIKHCPTCIVTRILTRARRNEIRIRIRIRGCFDSTPSSLDNACVILAGPTARLRSCVRKYSTCMPESD